jgi:hypothetical protein
MRSVSYGPAHHLYQIWDVIGKAQDVDVVDCQEVEALHDSLRPDYYLYMLATVESFERLLELSSLFARYLKETKRLERMTVF